VSEEKKFGKLRLSVKGTNNGSGFDIFYDFGKKPGAGKGTEMNFNSRCAYRLIVDLGEIGPLTIN
jgi:hypothetical protein